VDDQPEDKLAAADGADVRGGHPIARQQDRCMHPLGGIGHSQVKGPLAGIASEGRTPVDGPLPEVALSDDFIEKWRKGLRTAELNEPDLTTAIGGEASHTRTVLLLAQRSLDNLRVSQVHDRAPVCLVFRAISTCPRRGEPTGRCPRGEEVQSEDGPPCPCTERGHRRPHELIWVSGTGKKGMVLCLICPGKLNRPGSPVPGEKDRATQLAGAGPAYDNDGIEVLAIDLTPREDKPR